jgi:hypothetical protein
LPRVIVVEPVPSFRDALGTRLIALGERLAVVDTMAEAQEWAAAAPSVLVIARNAGGADHAAASACGFDLAQGPGALRLVLVAAHAVSHYFHEVDRTVAEALLPAEPVPHGVPGLPAEFPHGTYVPLRQVGRAACAELVLVRHRITGAKELLVQVEEQACAAEVQRMLYRNFQARQAVATGVLRHELTRHHSFIASRSIPLDFARHVDEAVASRPASRRAA